MRCYLAQDLLCLYFAAQSKSHGMSQGPLTGPLYFERPAGCKQGSRGQQGPLHACHASNEACESRHAPRSQSATAVTWQVFTYAQVWL